MIPEVLQRELNARIASWEARFGIESESDDYRFGIRCERLFRTAKEQRDKELLC